MSTFEKCSQIGSLTEPCQPLSSQITARVRSALTPSGYSGNLTLLFQEQNSLARNSIRLNDHPLSTSGHRISGDGCLRSDMLMASRNPGWRSSEFDLAEDPGYAASRGRCNFTISLCGMQTSILALKALLLRSHLGLFASTVLSSGGIKRNNDAYILPWFNP